MTSPDFVNQLPGSRILPERAGTQVPIRIDQQSGTQDRNTSYAWNRPPGYQHCAEHEYGEDEQRRQKRKHVPQISGEDAQHGSQHENPKYKKGKGFETVRQIAAAQVKDHREGYQDPFD